MALFFIMHLLAADNVRVHQVLGSALKHIDFVIGRGSQRSGVPLSSSPIAIDTTLLQLSAGTVW